MAGSANHGYEAAREVAIAARAAFQRQREGSADQTTRMAGLAMAQIGLAGLNAIGSLFGGIKKRTAEKDSHKLDVKIRNVTPYPIVFSGTHDTQQGEGVPVMLQPDNDVSWSMRKGRIAVNASGGGLAFRCKIVKSRTQVLELTVVFSDESSNDVSRTVRIHSVSFDGDITWVIDPNRQEESKVVHPTFYKATSPFPVYVFAVPVTNGTDSKMQVVILSPDSTPA